MNLQACARPCAWAAVHPGWWSCSGRKDCCLRVQNRDGHRRPPGRRPGTRRSRRDARYCSGAVVACYRWTSCRPCLRHGRRRLAQGTGSPDRGYTGRGGVVRGSGPRIRDSGSSGLRGSSKRALSDVDVATVERAVAVLSLGAPVEDAGLRALRAQKRFGCNAMGPLRV